VTNEQILADAEAALGAALDETALRNVRRDAMGRLMKAFEQLAQQVAQGTATWDEARRWGQRNAQRFCDARDALADWQSELAKWFDFGNEEEIECALDRRSQHAFAREVFAGTDADELLATYESEEGDAEFRQRAELIRLYAPHHAPRSHTWWFWHD
jgi:hypothetical protein